MKFFMRNVLFYAIKEGKQSRQYRLWWLLYFLSFLINANKTGLISLESSNKARRFSRRWLDSFIKSICVIAAGRDPNNLKWLALGDHEDRTQPNSEMRQRVVILHLNLRTDREDLSASSNLIKQGDLWCSCELVGNNRSI